MNTAIQIHVHIHINSHANTLTELHNMPSTTWCVDRYSECCIKWKWFYINDTAYWLSLLLLLSISQQKYQRM